MAAYAIGIVLYGLKKGKQESSEDYFLAGRNISWPVVGISLFAANISSYHLVGMAGDAYDSGIAVYNYEWVAAFVLVFFALFFLPFYLRSGVYTMPEFLERRYDKRSRYFFSFLTIVGNVLADTAAPLYAGLVIMGLVFPDVNEYVIIFGLAAAAAIYTIPGGLNAVIHTEVIQALLLIAGSVLLTLFTWDAIGGVDGWYAAKEAGIITNDQLKIVKPIGDEQVPWPGLILGVPLLGFYFWATNQFMVQRVLSAKDISHGRRGALFAGLLKLPVLFIMVLPGVMAQVLYSGEQTLQRADLAFPTLMFDMLPGGLRGLVLVALLAAMASSISATLNSASTLITMDFVSKFRPGLTSKQLVRVGQISTLILVIIAAMWVPQVSKVGSLFRYLQLVATFIAPPIVALFIFGLFWKKANGTGAIASFLATSVVIIFMLSFLNVDAQKAGILFFDMFGYQFTAHFLYLAPFFFVICSLVLIAVSLLTSAPEASKVQGLLWTKKLYHEETEDLRLLPWYQNYRLLSALLLFLTALIVIWWW